MKAYNQAKIRWCSRVPETSTEAKAALAEVPKKWQEFSDQSGHYFSLQLKLRKARGTLGGGPYEKEYGGSPNDTAKESQ
jgi:hypothetical protein